MRDANNTAFSLDRLEQAVAGYRVVPPTPTGRSANIPDDEQEEPDCSDERQEANALGLFITYVDAKNHRSMRRITVRGLVGIPPELISAYCHERRAPRTFRLDRIEEAAIAETGEILMPSELLAALKGEGVIAVPPELSHAINILVFLMRCDGHEHPAEWETIDNALARFVLRFGGADRDHAAAMRLARAVAPDSDSFLIGMRSFAASSISAQIGQWLALSVMELIDADQTQHQEEFRWVTEVNSFLAIMGDRAATRR